MVALPVTSLSSAQLSESAISTPKREELVRRLAHFNASLFSPDMCESRQMLFRSAYLIHRAWGLNCHD